jgi:electron transport complex protein RnfC
MTAVYSTRGTGRIARGVHPHERKDLSRGRAIEVLPTPGSVAIALLQHTGAACEAIVKTRDAVVLGAKLAEAKAFISAPVHASISGVVQRESVTTLPNGRHVKTLPIQSAAENLAGDELIADLFGGDWSLDSFEDRDPAAIVQAIREAGIVGHGGAAFPTHVKLTRNPAKPVDVILLNGCECEPYLTADYRMMVEFPAPILAGARLAARAAGATRVCIAVEDNKPEAIAALRKAVQGSPIEVLSVQSRYPMGGEKQTVRAALGRTLPTGGLPLDVGVVVLNVASAAAIARAVLRGKPLTHRVVSVTGAGVVSPKNVLAPVGASYQSLIDFCGGLKPGVARVIAGGPMMGFSLGSLDIPITKGTSGIVALTDEDVRRTEETTCVRCGRCVDVCPLNLVPTRLALASRHKNWDMARRYYLTACMECGCCAYVCPASIPLVQLMRMGKAQMLKETSPK